ncbi:MAG: cation:proton antiporter [Anaerolineae bacterium]
MNLLLLTMVTLVVIVTTGYVINKYTRLPWMFTVVIFGMVLSALGLFQEVFASESFTFLARMGMLFFLLTIGIDLDLREIRKLGAYIAGGDILLTLTEGLLLALFFYFVLPDFVNHSFVIALASGIAFGTVGEVVLAAILKEFHLEKTRFGQLALGIGVFDDIFEILVLAVVIAMPAFIQGTGSQSVAWGNVFSIVLTLVGLVAVTILIGFTARYIRPLFKKIPANSFVTPFIILAVVFAFIYLSSTRFENMGVIAAIFGGISIKLLLPEPMLEQHKKPLFFVANVFLGPFFFLSLGSKMSFSALITYPLVILAVIVIALGTRISLSYLLFRKLLGKRASLVMGIGLTSKFSTSVITENLLLTTGLITAPMFSVLMGAFIVLKPLIVGAFSRGAALISDEQIEQHKQISQQPASPAMKYEEIK